MSFLSDDPAQLKTRLADLRARRRELIAMSGRRGEKHPSARMIGALNPAALELYNVRGEIRELEARLRAARNKPA